MNRLPFALGVLSVLVIGGFAFTWWKLFGMQVTLAALAKRLDATVTLMPVTTDSRTGLPVSSVNTTVSPQLESAVATLSAHVRQLDREFQAVLENQGSAPTDITVSPTTGGVRETLIFMGSGNTTSRDWTNITSAQVTIDTSKFPPIKEVRFEAALSIIGGEAHARLARTDGSATYYNSEVMNNTSTSTWSSSGPFQIGQGNVSYTVQLHSTSGERASLDGARVKLIFQ